MSTTRAPRIPRAPAGKCRGCGGDVQKPRRTWCSDRCVTEALIRSDPAVARAEVYRRDAGVCSRCGLDTDQLGRVLLALHRRHRGWRPPDLSVPLADPRSRWDAPMAEREAATLAARWLFERVLGVKFAAGLAWVFFPARHLWEADHVRPVVEGGGGCGLENYRTVCVSCHRFYTAELAKRRADRRRQTESQPGLLP